MPNLVVLGDSIQWGQGLSGADKMSTLLAKAWKQASGEAVVIHSYAHSGADIWDDGQSGIIAIADPTPPQFPLRLPKEDGAILQTRACAATQQERDAIGEIPDEEPYSLRQILDAGQAIGVEADLVLFDAGINDTEVYNLVLPGKDSSAVVKRGRSIEPRVEFCLRKIGELFPKAAVLVTGYYPVVTLQTDLFELLQFTARVVGAAAEEGIQLAGRLAELRDLPALDLSVLSGGMFLGSIPAADSVAGRLLPAGLNPLRPLLRSLAGRSAEWTANVHVALQNATTTYAKDTGRVAGFVDPRFGSEHGLFAPHSMLWAFKRGQPTDPLAQARRDFCKKNGIVGFDRLLKESASLGHPNPAGAKRYADALITEARKLKIF